MELQSGSVRVVERNTDVEAISNGVGEEQGAGDQLGLVVQRNLGSLASYHVENEVVAAGQLSAIKKTVSVRYGYS